MDNAGPPSHLNIPNHISREPFCQVSKVLTGSAIGMQTSLGAIILPATRGSTLRQEGCARVGVCRACGAGHLVTKAPPCTQPSSTVKCAAAICHCPLRASLCSLAAASKVPFPSQLRPGKSGGLGSPMLGSWAMDGPGGKVAQPTLSSYSVQLLLDGFLQQIHGRFIV